jgi:hypothetical protein
MFRVISAGLVVVSVGVAALLALVSLLAALRGNGKPRLSLVAMAISFVCLVSSSLANWQDSEAFGGARMPYPSAAVLAFAVISFTVCRKYKSLAGQQPPPPAAEG